MTSKRAKRDTFSKRIGARQSRSCAGRASVCTTLTAATTSTCCPASACVARPRASAAHARNRRSGGDAAPHVELVLPPASGRAGRAPRESVRAAALVLLQQRHRSGRGLPQVRAPLLVHARRAAAWRSSRSKSRSTGARSDRCRSPPTSTIARRSSRCCRA